MNTNFSRLSKEKREKVIKEYLKLKSWKDILKESELVNSENLINFEKLINYLEKNYNIPIKK